MVKHNTYNKIIILYVGFIVFNNRSRTVLAKHGMSVIIPTADTTVSDNDIIYSLYFKIQIGLIMNFGGWFNILTIY